MKKVRVEDAIGETLCHDMTGILPGGKKGVVFARGHVVTAEDIPALLDIGKYHVFVEAGDSASDVHEDDAALIAADAVCGDGITYDTTPMEGKIVFYAAARGLFCVARESLREINSVGDYTIVCLPRFIDVAEGQKLGGIRIIPLTTAQSTVDAMLTAAHSRGPVFRVLPYSPLKCGAIITGSEVYHGRIEDKFEPIVREKVERYGGEFLGAVKCPDDLEVIAQAIADFESRGAELILLTGGMSVDPDDLTPTAIRQSGAEVITQGMPMQPGNMLMIAKKPGVTLIGVPGASMHSPVTSLDVFLPRIFAGVDIGRAEIAGLGEGGFCSACETCTYPRCYFGNG